MCSRHHIFVIQDATSAALAPAGGSRELNLHDAGVLLDGGGLAADDATSLHLADCN